MQNLIRTYFKTMSTLAPELAAGQAFELFQKTFRPEKRFRKNELEFYKHAGRFTTKWEREDLKCYDMGDPKNEMVILVHGWNSNAGSMHAIANEMLKAGYYVVTLDLPAHGYSILNKSNLIACSAAFASLVHRLLPDRPFSVVSHSFGSAVVSHALSGSRFNIDRWVMLTSPNKISDIFREYKEMIGLTEPAYGELVGLAEAILNEKIELVSVEQKIKKISFGELLIIHDRVDRILPFENSVAISKAMPNTRLVALENIGHYKMLQHREVMSEIRDFLAPGLNVNILRKQEIPMLS